MLFCINSQEPNELFSRQQCNKNKGTLKKKTKKTKGYEYNINQQQLPTHITKHCTCRGAGGVSPKTGRFAMSPFRSQP